MFKSDFWFDKNDRYRGRYKFTDEVLVATEEQLGVKLPKFYTDLLFSKNGGTIRYNAFPLSDKEFFPVFFIRGSDYNPRFPTHGLGIINNEYNASRYNIDNKIVIFAGDEFKAIGFDYRHHQENPPIVLIERNSDDAIQIADCFKDFYDKLVVYDFSQQLDENEMVDVEDTQYIRKFALTFYHLDDQSKTLRENCVADIVKWEYANHDRHKLPPLFFERNGWQRGRALKDSEHKDICLHYGYNQDGQLIYIKKELPNGLKWDTYILFQYKNIFAYTFDMVNELLDSVEIMIQKDGRPYKYREYITRNGISDNWGFFENYFYEGEQLVEVTKLRESFPSSRENFLEKFSIAYGPKGDVKGINRDPGNRLIYIKKLNKKKYEDLKKAVINGLVERTAAAIFEAAKGGQELCFANFYMHDDPSDAIDNTVRIGKSEERLELLGDSGNVLEMIWNSSEYGQLQFVPVYEKETEFGSEVITLMRNVESKRNWFEEAKNIMTEVCRKLNKMDWGEKEGFTCDFVVYTDWESFGIEDLARSIPEEKMGLLKAGGLVP
ncbi:MAG: SMI1/KNR4 family protein [Bacillota bacterium]